MNNEDELLLSFAEDKLRLCDENCMLANTRFLDIRQQSVLSGRFCRDKRCRLIFYGGYPGCERSVCVFVPPLFSVEDESGLMQYFNENPGDNPLSAIRVTKDRFSSELSHRDYLGALMSLGIKREVLGDIIAAEGGCDIVTMSSMAGYIAENLTGVARASVAASIIGLDELRAPEEKYDETFHSVASLRLDAVASAAFKLSRTKAVDCITRGLVYVNGVQTEKTDYRLSVGDKLVLRGSGKAVVSETPGKSKKGRQRLIIRIYK